jgi:glycosyltransferase involved in cell wall biosynthesis
MADTVAARIWIDVEDLFEYARGNPRPSGIQRLAFEIYKALQARGDAAEVVHFVRHDTPRNSFQLVSWPEIQALFAHLTESEPDTALTFPGAILPHARSRIFIRKLVHRLPPTLRAPVIDVAVAQLETLRAWKRLVGALIREGRSRLMSPIRSARSASRRRERAAASGSGGDPRDFFGRMSAPGDVLLVLGSPWSHPDYAQLIQTQRLRGLRFALLVYDLIPIRRPEWCDRGLVRVFRSWFDSIFPLCDTVFAISRATARDVELYAAQNGITLSGPIVPIPIGTSFGAPDVPSPAPRTRRLPKPGSYALIVSTVEARKNHMLLFRVWRQMLDELPPDSIPTLVFAGRVGWLVDDLLRQIANTNNLDGKLVLIENPTDVELVALYEGCQFTLFPSFFEGWGLPVTESLALGKPCLTSDRTSLPESGGKLTRRFDPDNLHEAYDAIKEVVEDPAGLARWEAQVRREFKPVSWSVTADALLAGLDHPLSANQETIDFSAPEPEEELDLPAPIRIGMRAR